MQFGSAAQGSGQLDQYRVEAKFYRRILREVVGRGERKAIVLTDKRLSVAVSFRSGMLWDELILPYHLCDVILSK